MIKTIDMLVRYEVEIAGEFSDERIISEVEDSFMNSVNIFVDTVNDSDDGLFLWSKSVEVKSSVIVLED